MGEPGVEGKCKVIVRVRPLLENEPKDADAVSVDTEKNNIQVRVLSKSKKLSSTEKNGKATAKAKSYNFDYVLGPNEGQDDLFRSCDIEGLVQSSLQGYSQTVFAFGQTGSGKTYSICGKEDERTSGDKAPSSSTHTVGLLEEASKICFDKAGKMSSEVQVDITCLEIYQEQVTDLLVEKKQVLPVRHHPKYGFYVQGLTQKQCQTVADYQEVVGKAFQRRRVASHSLNERSTRSHLLITIHLTCVGGDEGMSTFGRLCFVDLAGSERLGDTKSKSSSATIRAETGSINKSLFALGKVISMLGNMKSRKSNVIIPFRDSKLTQLLMDSLQGKGQATMIACCSPLPDHCDVTLSTLHYASLAQNVKSDPVIIHDPQDQLVIDLRRTIMELKEQNKKLAVQLTQLTSDSPMPAPAPEPAAAALAAPKAAQPAATKVVEVAKSPRPNGVVGSGAGAKVVTSARKDNKKSSESIRILKERSTIKRKTKSRRKSTGPPKSGPGSRTSPAAIAQSPYGTDSVSRPGAKTARVPSAKIKSKVTSSAKKSATKVSQKRVLKESLQMNLAPTSVDDFPDLAALEANFQAQLAQLNNGPSEAPKGGANQLSGLDHSINAMADTVTDDSKGMQEELEGDEEAVRWAKKNPWFGNDYEMTEYAYEIHDLLVDRNVDPNSRQYYMEIEKGVRERFPDRMPKPTPKPSARRVSRTVGSRLSQSAKTSGAKSKKGFGARTITSDLSSEGSCSSESLNNHCKTTSSPAKNSSGRKSIDFSYSTDRNGGPSKNKSERQYIVEELRRIKQEAEEERRWIMNQISTTIKSSYNGL
ncbi:kinesin [Chloropicon primus]|uniref:Kinesin-like protein n=1 Tax=Chloropicon primus TaxID=1764295 RepID=A0A5B8MGQ1_9CHLO|nr:kinesin [Chloropicon primus]UPQ97731.1 kinesin [Chloropicon primus]|eukprot:QDZ18522.1 kinesin [Chloropicon primus]